MPRYIAVKCAGCDLYQSIQEPKNGKWACRVCSAKNSVVRIFAVSEQAKDIRGIVQQYNLERGKAVENVQAQIATKRAAEILESDEGPATTVADLYASLDSKKPRAAPPQPSGEKWAGLLDEPEHSDSDDADDLAAQGLVTSLPAKEVEGKKKRRAQAPGARAAKPAGEALDEGQDLHPPPSRPVGAKAATHSQRAAIAQPRAPPPLPRVAPAVVARQEARVSAHSTPTRVAPLPPAPSPKAPAPQVPQAFPYAMGKPAAAALQRTLGAPLPKPAPAVAAASGKWGDLLPAGDDSGDDGAGGNDGLVFAAQGGEEAL